MAQNWVTQTLAQTPMPDQRIKNIGIAYKTGTSYGFRDAWSIGYDNDHVVGIWVGKADGTPCPGYHGRQIAAPLMMQIFDYLKISPIAVHEQTIIQDHKPITPTRSGSLNMNRSKRIDVTFLPVKQV